MKLRNFLIVLFALLIAFAFASCKHEPEVKPDPTPKIEHPIYQIVVDEGVEKDYYNRDKIKLRWTDVEVNDGSVITLKYRSERGVYQWDIRDEGAGVKWVYETDKNGFVDPVKGEDGWYTLTYTLGKDIKGEDFDYPNDAIAVYFRGRYAQGDVFEIKDVTLDGKPLETTAATVISKAHLVGDGAIEDHEWNIPENYVYLLAMGALGEVDKNPIIAKVAPNAAVDLSKIPEKENYKVHIYSDSAFANELAETAPVTADATIVYYKYVGDPRLVTIDLNGGTADPAIENINAEYGSPIAEPEVIPTVDGGNLFAGWYKDLSDEAPYEFSTPVEENFTLHAKYTAPVTVHFNTGDGNPVDDVVIASGTAVAQPEEDPTYPANLYMFAGWFADAECTTAYDFSTIITAEKTIYAKWIDAKKVTFNLNYEGAPAATVIGVDTGTAATAPEEVPMRAGWVFEGWYTEADCKNKYNFATPVTADTPLFAKWGEGTTYKMVATKGDGSTSWDKFVLDWQTYTDAGLPGVFVNKNDVLSFKYRTTQAFSKFNVRGANKWVYETGADTLTEHIVGDDGWITVSYKFGEYYYDGKTTVPYGDNGLVFRFDFISTSIRPGDILEVKAITLNGEGLELVKVDYDAKTFSVIEAEDDWTVKHTVTFVYDDGDGDTRGYTTAALDFCTAVALPEDTEKAGKSFVGWYTDDKFQNKFDSSRKLTEDTTLYGYWVAPVTVTIHDGEATSDKEFAYGSTITASDLQLGKVGSFVEWYADAGLKTLFDFSAAINGDTDVYAKWVEPTEYYRFTAKAEADDKDRFQWVWTAEQVGVTEFKKGDTLTIMVKSTPSTGSALAEFRLRNGAEADIGYKYVAFPAADDQGWCSITVTFDEDKPGSGLVLGLYGSGHGKTCKAGDICEIKAAAFNGVALPVGSMSYAIDATREVVPITKPE